MRVLPIPGGTIELHESGLTVTRLDGLGEVMAWPQDTDAYRRRAAAHGYGDDLFAMSREHEAAHALLSITLGLPVSPTMAGVARGSFWPHWGREEAAVLALQAFARAAGVSIVGRIEEMGRMSAAATGEGWAMMLPQQEEPMADEPEKNPETESEDTGRYGGGRRDGPKRLRPEVPPGKGKGKKPPEDGEVSPQYGGGRR